MKFLKSIFFSKYKPTKEFSYTTEWKDISVLKNNQLLSIKVNEKQNPNGIVILAHPLKSEAKYFFIDYGHTTLYNELNYTQVIFDFNGFGQSTDVGFNFKEDITTVIDEVKSSYPNLPIYLHGVSFGASQIILAGIEREKEIEGLIIESAVSSNIDYYKGRGSQLYYFLNLYNSVLPRKNAHNIYTNMIQKLSKVPILLLYGSRDVITPQWMGEKLYQNTNVKKHIELIDAEHLTLISEQPEQYKTAINTFLNE